MNKGRYNNYYQQNSQNEATEVTDVTDIPILPQKSDSDFAPKEDSNEERPRIEPAAESFEEIKDLKVKKIESNNRNSKNEEEDDEYSESDFLGDDNQPSQKESEIFMVKIFNNRELIFCTMTSIK